MLIKFNLNYIGEKMINKYKRKLINFHKVKLVKIMELF